MKKLMIGAAVAAITVGAFASVCEDPANPTCKAWDLKMTLKSLGPKKISCKGSCEDSVYYMDNVSRKLKGYLWVCEYECGTDYNVVLWDSKNKVAVIAAPREGSDYQTISAGDEVYVYGKKMNKVAGNIQFTGMDANGEDGIDVYAAGVNGKFVQGNSGTDCYIKSLSGNVAGSIGWVAKEYDGKKAVIQEGGLCQDEIILECEEITAKLIPICDACAYCDTWCDSTDDAPALVPATGTWSMKYNKKISKGDKTIQALVPSYAL